MRGPRTVPAARPAPVHRATEGLAANSGSGADMQRPSWWQKRDYTRPERATHCACRSARSKASDHHALNEAEEHAAATLLPVIDSSMLSPAVRRYVNELLMGGENPSPSTRHKLVEAANR